MDRPPFTRGAGMDLAETTSSLEQMVYWLQTRERPATDATRLLLDARCARLSQADAPYRQAITRLADGIDDGSLSRPVEYHHRIHYCEVMLSAHYLGLQLELDPEQLAQLVLAAEIHDLGHDGSMNLGSPFRLERSSLEMAKPYLQMAGLDDGVLATMTALVLATDIMNGLAYARACFDFHFQAAPPPGTAPDPAMASLAGNSVLASMAIALTEADALASAGLSPESADRQERQLAAERGWVVHPRRKLDYLDNVFPNGFRVAKAFNANLEYLRAQARASCAP